MSRSASATAGWATEPGWRLATTLAERRGAGLGGGAPTTRFDAELAERRLRELCATQPFDRAGELSRRLAVCGLDEAGFHRLLGTTTPAIAAESADATAWLVTLRRAYGGSASSSPTTVASPAAPGAGLDALAPFVEPLVDDAVCQVEGRLEGSAARTLLPEAGAHPLVAPYLRWLLLRTATPTLVLELHVARLRGELDGDTAEARFASFCTGLRNRSRARALLAEYPVLGRLLATTAGQVAEAMAETLSRAAADRDLLTRSFAGGGDPGRLVGLSPGLGDRHGGGRTVSFLRFASGLEVVYKPRPLAVDHHYHELLAWLTSHGFEPPLAGHRVVDRGDYGWAEKVLATPCTDEAEIGRFYRRLGGLLAVLYVLGGTDFHFENLIAAGEHPVLVDLETLLHPLPVVAGDTINQVQARALLDSVKRTGLLPERYWGEDEFGGVELSGLAGAGGQEDVIESRFWADAGTDRMHAVARRAAVGGSDNRPRLGAEPVDSRVYRRELELGFTRAYRLLAEHRRELARPGGPLAAFAGDRVRYLLRPSRAYQVVLDKGFHPDHLRDSADRELLFERLWMPADEVPATAQRRAGDLFASELDDLVEGDIPIFTTTADSCDLDDSRGRRVPGYFERSALDAARRRLERLDGDDLERQLWMIRASLAKLPATPGGSTAEQQARRAPLERPPTGSRSHHRAARPSAASAADPLAAAVATGERLARLAVHGDGRCGWFTLKPADDGDRWAVKVAGLDLARGLPGIVAFLSHLAGVTGRDDFHRLGRGALTALLDIVDEYEEAGADARDGDWPGAYHGWGGVLYALTTAAAVLGDERATARAATVAGVVVERLATAEGPGLDLGIDRGAAGGVLALLAAEAVLGDPDGRLLAAARRTGDGLLRPAVEDAYAGEHRPGTGPARAEPLAHGTAGIAYALLRLALRTGDDELRQLAEAELRRAVAAALDRVETPGLLSLGLALLDLPAETHEPWRDCLCRLAGATVLAEPPQDDDSLASGAAGRALLLDGLARTADDSRLGDSAAGAIAELAAPRDGHARVGPDAGGTEVPGLLTGLAGVGCALLRLARPAVPLPLTLGPPPPSALTRRIAPP